jgi:curved DNA-binding protein CbpA
MFKDYYAILNILPTASQDKIKQAFKKQALKWHPDRNPGQDTTIEMQEINEAYLILKDLEAKEHYDKAYIRYKDHLKAREFEMEDFESAYAHNEYEGTNQRESKYEYSDFDIEDDILKKWMANAKKQAVDLAIRTIKDMATLTTEGAKATGKEMGQYTIAYIVIGVVFTIIFSLIRSCN